MTIGQITPVSLPPLQPPYPHWYRQDETCVYHNGAPGHNIENCVGFKRQVRSLIDQGLIAFEDATGSPSVSTNPLPDHAAGGVNMLSIEESEFNRKRSALKLSMSSLLDLLRANGFEKDPVQNQLPIHDEDLCKYHQTGGHDIEDCAEFCEEVETMLILGTLSIGRFGAEPEVCTMTEKDEETQEGLCRYEANGAGPARLILRMPAPVKKDYSALPYNYGATSQPGGSRVIMKISSTGSVDIGGITRTGRCYTPEEPRVEKGKNAEVPTKTGEVNKPVEDEEAVEFLKMMKHSEYSVVDQLKKTPARISLMSLILSSEPHRKALQRVLNEAYIPQDMTVESINHLIGQVQSTNYLYFTEDELGPEGVGHNKALYISVKCKDCTVATVLIDNGSALNVLPKYMLDRLPIDTSHMRPSKLTAKAYDGTHRSIVGDIDIDLDIGAHRFLVTLHVIDIQPSYSMLLGRPWIHSAGVVASSLHQRLKYIANGKLVTVKAEEPIVLAKNVSVPYIEREEACDGDLHAFEVVNAELIPKNALKRKPELSQAVKMAAKYMLKCNASPRKLGSEPPLNVTLQKLKNAEQRFGLGFKPTKKDFQRMAALKREKRMARIENRDADEEGIDIPPIRVTFPKPAYVANVKEEDWSLCQLFGCEMVDTMRTRWDGTEASSVTPEASSAVREELLNFHQLVEQWSEEVTR